MRRFVGDLLLVATQNKGKCDEIAAMLQPLAISVVRADELGLPVPDEVEDSFLGNARIKAHAAAQATGLPALADDSGLEVHALGGAPGVRTADWATGPNGRVDHLGMTRVWTELVASGAAEPWAAQFRCQLVLAWPDAEEVAVSGEITGRIIWPKRGDLGHGYDPIFQPNGYTQTFAEMEPGEKNRISHRAVALARLKAACFG